MDQLGNDVYISLDQSTTACGYAVWENSCLIGHGVYKPSALDSADKRIEEIRKWFSSLLEYCAQKGNIKLIYFEDIQLQETINGSKKYFGNSQNNVVTFKTLAHLQGVLANVCLQNGYEYKFITPSSWKSKCGIKSQYRRDQKKETMDFVDKIYNITSKEDEADAICIGKSQLE